MFPILLKLLTTLALFYIPENCKLLTIIPYQSYAQLSQMSQELLEKYLFSSLGYLF